MKLPIKGTRGRAIIDFLAGAGRVTIAQVRTGMATTLTPRVTGIVITDLKERGLIYNVYGSEHAKQDDVIAITRGCRDLLDNDADDESEVKKARGPLVPPRQVNVLNAPPLHPSRFMNVDGSRTGSDRSNC